MGKKMKKFLKKKIKIERDVFFCDIYKLLC